ncbi:hypothetical protein [Breoghania sp.]|uniref:hypothetical protein n=1 Tax=Breoghania sp. TaxID=2065378 RepID=UPI0029CA6692|nr:hypothetical protein [Breoghania sp.]
MSYSRVLEIEEILADAFRRGCDFEVIYDEGERWIQAVLPSSFEVDHGALPRTSLRAIAADVERAMS